MGVLSACDERREEPNLAGAFYKSQPPTPPPPPPAVVDTCGGGGGLHSRVEDMGMEPVELFLSWGFETQSQTRCTGVDIELSIEWIGSIQLSTGSNIRDI